MRGAKQKRPRSCARQPRATLDRESDRTAPCPERGRTLSRGRRTEPRWIPRPFKSKRTRRKKTAQASLSLSLCGVLTSSFISISLGPSATTPSGWRRPPRTHRSRRCSSGTTWTPCRSYSGPTTSLRSAGDLIWRTGPRMPSACPPPCQGKNASDTIPLLRALSSDSDDRARASCLSCLFSPNQTQTGTPSPCTTLCTRRVCSTVRLFSC